MSVIIQKSDHDPRGFCLTTELLVSDPREQVFEFFADAFQLETITPPWLHFSVQTPRPIEMKAATLIDYKLQLHGLPVRWRSKISVWQPPFRFVDEQVKGPYRYWHHLHTFEETEGGTLVSDIVRYAADWCLSNRRSIDLASNRKRLSCAKAMASVSVMLGSLFVLLCA